VDDLFLTADSGDWYTHL